MSIADMPLSNGERSSRWLLLASLALNLFFVGVGGALLWQTYAWNQSLTGQVSSHNIDTRIQQIAATLPPEDGDKLRTAFAAKRTRIDDADSNFHRARNAVRAAVAAQPFDGDALRAAMGRLRVARQAVDRQVQDFFADLVPTLSQAGRQKLADWHSSHRSHGQSAPTDSATR